MLSSLAVVLPIWAALANAAGPQAIPTKSFNASAATTGLPNKDYSNERLAFLWNQVFRPTLT